MLNGFPIVNYGGRCRRPGLEKPVQVRHGTPDARLLSKSASPGPPRGWGIPTISPTQITAGEDHLALAIYRPTRLYEEAGVSPTGATGPLTGT